MEDPPLIPDGQKHQVDELHTIQRNHDRRATERRMKDELKRKESKRKSRHNTRGRNWKEGSH